MVNPKAFDASTATVSDPVHPSAPMRTDTMIRALLLLSGLTFLGVVAAAVAVQHWSFDDTPVTAHSAPLRTPAPSPRPDAATVAVAGPHAATAPATPISAAPQGMEGGTAAPGDRGGAGAVHLTEGARPGRPTAGRVPGDIIGPGEGERPGAYDRETGTSGNPSYPTHSGAIGGRAPAPEATATTGTSVLPPPAPTPATGNPDARAPLPAPSAAPGPTPGATPDQPPADISDGQPPSPDAPSREEDTATASTADEAREELAFDDAEPWPNANCPERLPPGSTRATADIMTRTYGCQYLQYCQAVNDGSGDTRCWWGAWRLPGG